MKKLNSSVALAALAAVLSTPAVAADVAAPAPEVADWTALHIGVGGGGNFGFVDESADGLAHTEDEFMEDFIGSASHSADLGDAGFFGTVEAGFDYQMDSLVIGLLANYDFGKTKMANQSDGVVTNENGNAIDNTTFETKWEIGDSWAIGGRLGFLAMDNALVYVLGGYTQAKIKTEASLTGDNNANFGVSSSDSAWEDGWFVGGGVETLLTENISLKAEYRYNDYGSIDRADLVFVENDDINVGTEQSGNVTVHSVRAVLSYRFGL